MIISKSKNILHLTPHLGGGVGRVVLNYLIRAKQESFFSHKVVCLDYANESAISIAKENEIELEDNAFYKLEKLLIEIKKADIILVHWWNHPLLYDFLVNNDIPASRVIFWSHISGFHPPYVFTEKALSYPDLFVFTTPLSFEAKEVMDFEGKEKLKFVWSTGGVNHVKAAKPVEHKGFNVGYLGTVDYCKIHPDFLKISSRIDIPNVKFTVCGGANHEEMKKEAADMGLSEKFDFTGLVSDVQSYYESFDVFGYPLASYHYGTCDQVLAESMAAGVVPVVFSNKMEKYMVKDKETGLVVNSKDEYVQAIEFLYNNPAYRSELSENAQKYARETFSLNKMLNSWEEIFKEILNNPKKTKMWNFDKNTDKVTASQVFLESLGLYGDSFRQNKVDKIKELSENPLWKAKTRGTVFHYQSFFKEDDKLAYWAELMSK